MTTVTTPQMVTLSGVNLSDKSGVPNFEEGVRKYLLADRPDDTYWYAALWNGHEFECPRITAKFGSRFYFTGDDDIPGNTEESYMILYYPIDPRITYQDVAGAIRAYPNETNTGWLFAHCGPGYHHDRELILESAIDSLFAAEVDKVVSQVFTALAGDSGSVTTSRRVQYQRLLDFRASATNRLLRAARSQYIGYPIQHPHHSHYYEVIREAVAGAVQAWATSRPGELASIRGAVNRIEARLANPHAYETRWDQAARLEAERKAAEGESGDGDGTEGSDGDGS